MSDSNRIEELEKRVKKLEETVTLLLKWEQEKLNEEIKLLKERQLVRLYTSNYQGNLPTFEELLKTDRFWY